MKVLAAAICICALLPFIEALFGHKQSIGVKGRLTCGDTPLANTVIKLWDKNNMLDPDTKLGCGETDADGKYEIQGGTKEISDLAPEMHIYTDCNDVMLYGLSEKPCQRDIIMKIPTDYINTGEEVTNWFDADTMNMELKQEDESRHCALFHTCGILGGR